MKKIVILLMAILQGSSAYCVKMPNSDPYGLRRSRSQAPSTQTQESYTEEEQDLILAQAVAQEVERLRRQEAQQPAALQRVFENHSLAKKSSGKQPTAIIGNTKHCLLQANSSDQQVAALGNSLSKLSLTKKSSGKRTAALEKDLASLSLGASSSTDKGILVIGFTPAHEGQTMREALRAGYQQYLARKEDKDAAAQYVARLNNPQ